MRARIISSQGPAGKSAANTTAYATAAPFADIAGLPGFVGGYILVDPRSGKRVGIMLWDSQEALAANEPRLADSRARALERTGATLLSVEDFDVVANASPRA